MLYHLWDYTEILFVGTPQCTRKSELFRPWFRLLERYGKGQNNVIKLQ